MPDRSTRITWGAGFAFALLSTVASAGTVLAQSGGTPPAPPPPTSTAPEITAADITAHGKVLASDAFEGRKPGTPGEDKTVDYLEQQFKRIGLKPANAGSYIQQVPLVEIGIVPAGPMVVKGKGKEASFQPLLETMLLSRRLEPTPTVTDSEIIFLGYGVESPEWNWDDFAGIDVKGKTIIVLVNDPGYGSKDPALFKGETMTYYGRWTYKWEQAGRKGAAAVLIVHNNEAAAYPWQVVANGGRAPKLDLRRASGGSEFTTIEGWIQEDVARKIFAQAGQDFDKLKEAAHKRGFKPVPLGLTMSAGLKSTQRNVDSRNVVGLVPGKTRPDEVLLYSAHWDHLGRAPTLGQDDIFNGAMDNASGTAAMLEIAEAFAKGKQPDRTVAFLAYTAEEQGLLGSEYYAAHPLFPLAKTVGGYNIDGVGLLGAYNDLIITGAGQSELEDDVKRWAEGNNKSLTPEAFPSHGYYFRSDHFPLAKVGVPMLYAKGGLDIVGKGKDWGIAQAVKYRTERYHTPKDEWTDDLDLAGAVMDARFMYELGARLANSTVWPKWYPTSEFKAVREKSLKGG